MKKNSSLILIVILLALAGVSVYIYKAKSRRGTVNEEERNFSFKDTAAITKIFMADKNGHKATVERGKTSWVVNGKFPCRSEAILNLLEVIKNVEVKMPVNKVDRKTVLKFMAVNALKVEVYTADGLVKQYYVGHETADAEGSYMLLTDLESGENYKEPFVCFIPGFKGYLMPRFIADENEWRDRVVLNYIPPQMKEIRVQHRGLAPDSSFTIELLNASSFRLRDGRGQPLPFDEVKMRQYLAYFQNISYELLITGRNKRLQDSLAAQKPFCIITITTNAPAVKEYKFYRKHYDGKLDSKYDVQYAYDPDHLYLRFDEGREWALIQYFVFGKILIASPYFSAAASVKK